MHPKRPFALFWFIVGAGLLALTGCATGAQEPARVNTAVVPANRDGPKHRGFVALAKQGGIDALFLGDSITDFWRESNPATNHNGKAVFDQYFGGMRVANFGYSGDTTQQVLWRLQNGEGEGFQPKVVMLMIGTNNTGYVKGTTNLKNTSAEIAEGVTAVVHELRTRFPAARILLLGIFPRGDPGDINRVQIAAINATIARLNDNRHIFYLDIGSKFLDASGALPPDIMPDKLHPGPKGDVTGPRP